MWVVKVWLIGRLLKFLEALLEEAKVIQPGGFAGVVFRTIVVIIVLCLLWIVFSPKENGGK